MKKIPFSLIKLLNTLCVFAPFAFVWFCYYEPLTRTMTSKKVTVLLLVCYLCVFEYLTSKQDGFRVSIRRIGELVFSQIITVGTTDLVAFVVIWMLSVHFPNIVPGLQCFLVQCFVIAVVVFIEFKLFFASHPPKHAVIVYDVRQGLENLVSEYGLGKRFEIDGSYPIEQVIGDINCLKDAEVVFMCGIHSHDRNIVLKHCVEENKQVYMIPRVGDVMMSGAERMHMFHLPFLRVTRYHPPVAYRIAKRAFDLAVSGIALIILSPLMLATAIAVKSDGGPAFYKQVRLTQNGKRFSILKFRSMHVDAEKYSGAVLSSGGHDPRITKVGRIIRACRLDELPQLINIFLGDMSVVGPRPERPEIAEVYEKELPEFHLRLQCKAGLTGYAQVYGKYNTTPYDKLLLDLSYIARPSILEDLNILLATVQILFRKDSTEGVGEEGAVLKYEERSKD